MVLSVASGKPKLGSGGSMVAKLKLKGIDGRPAVASRSPGGQEREEGKNHPRDLAAAAHGVRGVPHRIAVLLRRRGAEEEQWDVAGGGHGLHHQQGQDC